MAPAVGGVNKWPNNNFHRCNICIFVVAKGIMLKVFLWLYLGGSEYVGDFLGSQTIKNNFGSIEKKAFMKRKSPDNFDMPFLYKLLQHSCGLADSKSHTWNNPETDGEKRSLEHSLYLLKEKRNQLCHKPELLMNMTMDDLEKYLDKVSCLGEHILREAGQRANLTSSQVDDCVNQMRKTMDDLKSKPTLSGMTAQEFAILSKRDLKKDHKPSPSSQSFLDLQVESKEDEATYRRDLKDFPLWKCTDGSLPKAIVLKGITGTGKTTICSYIFDSWISGSTEIPELQYFDLVISIQASSVTTCDLVDFLRSLMEDACLLCNRDDIPNFLKSLRILWLIDGYDESTKIARDLVEQIFSQANTSHSILLTTQPQQDEIPSLSKDSISEVHLQGLSKKGVEDFLLTMLGDKWKSFEGDAEALDKNLLEEIHNPLKLKLMVELWKEGKLSRESGASVYGLYEAITETRREKVKGKVIRDTGLTEKDISERVQSWISVLCKIAFDMTVSNKFTKLSNEHQQQLVKEAKILIYPDYCLSLFLQKEATENNISYSFVHGTQQIYFAAQYITGLVKGNGKLPKKFKQLFRKIYFFKNRHSDHFLYLTSLQVVSGIAQISIVDQCLIHDLVQLLSSMKCHFNAFEVLQHADYDPRFAEELGKVCDDKWMVFNHSVKAAAVLLPLAKPLVIVMFIENDLKGVHELQDLLEIISKRDLKVGLYFNSHLVSKDSTTFSYGYLNDICSPNAKCHLIMFGGVLSTGGLRFLKEMKELYFLYLKVSSNEDLYAIFYHLKYLRSLKKLYLYLEMPVVSAPPLNLFQERSIKLKIDILNMDESRVNDTANAIANICKCYEGIRLYDISANSAVEFVRRLQEKKVQVDYLMRTLECSPHGVAGYFAINYGGIPLVQPVAEFHRQWHSAHVETYEYDQSIVKARLLTTGVSKDRVVYREGDSLENFKRLKFA